MDEALIGRSERPASGDCVLAIPCPVIDPGQSDSQTSWRDSRTCRKIIVDLPLSRFHCMTPLIRRAMFLLLSLTLSVNGLGMAFARSDARDCCRDHAAMAPCPENGPFQAASIGENPCKHDGSADRSPADYDAQHSGAEYCPHCAGLGASAPMFLIAAGNAVDALTVPYEAPPYIGTVFPDERPKRLERPPAATSLS
jgi:hypothetical protein